MEERKENDQIEQMPLSCLRDSGLEKTCHRLIKINGGRFQSDKQKNYIFSQARKDNDCFAGPLWEEVKKISRQTDCIVIHQCWSYNGPDTKRKGNKWHYAFLIDEFGIRIALKASWNWVKSKNRVHLISKTETEWWKRPSIIKEQNAGLNEPDMEFVFKGVIKTFERESK